MWNENDNVSLYPRQYVQHAALGLLYEPAFACTRNVCTGTESVDYPRSLSKQVPHRSSQFLGRGTKVSTDATKTKISFEIHIYHEATQPGNS
jgi:hypothetical protein